MLFFFSGASTWSQETYNPVSGGKRYYLSFRGRLRRYIR